MHRNTEVWKDVPGHEGRYQVSSHGQVRSVAWRYIRSNGRSYTNQPRVLAQSTTNSGHRTVGLFRDKKQSTYLVHRLVLEAFVGPCPDGMEACHADDDPANNHVSNLRWDTRQENMLDRSRNGIHHFGAKTHCKYGHEFTPENTYRTPSRPTARWCRACKANRDRRYRRASRQAVSA